MIREVPYSAVAPWRSRASREHTEISDTANTRWFMDGAEACAGLMAVRDGFRIKGVYVDPAFRGAGVGTAITEQLIDLAYLEGAAFVEAFAWNPGFYLERGFEGLGFNAHGAQHVRKLFPKIPAQEVAQTIPTV